METIGLVLPVFVTDTQIKLRILTVYYCKVRFIILYFCLRVCCTFCIGSKQLNRFYLAVSQLFDHILVSNATANRSS